MANEDPTGIDEIQLEVLYKQPIQNCYSYDQSTGVATYKETWKGNFTHVTDTYKTLQNWSPTGVDDFQTYSDFVNAAGGSSKLNYKYAPPSLPTGVEWKLNVAEVNECKAGDNAELTITWVSPNMGQFEPIPESLTWEERWTVNWQTQTASIYAYCGNTGKHQDSDDESMRACVAQRTAIENWFNLPNEFNAVKDSLYFQDNLNVVRPLNAAENKIAGKMMQGKSQVMFHYPIVQLIQTTKVKKSQLDNALASITFQVPDKIVPTTGFPGDIKYPSGTIGWSWLTQGSTVDVQISDEWAVITWTNTWWGAADTPQSAGWDENFYGDGSERWLFGMA